MYLVFLTLFCRPYLLNTTIQIYKPYVQVRASCWLLMGYAVTYNILIFSIKLQIHLLCALQPRYIILENLRKRLNVAVCRATAMKSKLKNSIGWKAAAGP